MADVADGTDGLIESLRRLAEDFERAARLAVARLYGAYEHSAEGIPEQEVVFGLLARQASLAIGLLRSPQSWNGDMAPVMLRTMIDLHLTLAWILQDPAPRSREFVNYGLGRTKLYAEHLKQQIEMGEADPSMSEYVQALEAFISADKYPWLVEVNTGAWGGEDLRKMAQATDQENLYNLAYSPFSAATHNTWQHVSMYNLIPCEEPLHALHRVPAIAVALFDPDYAYRAAKYLDRSLGAVAEWLGESISPDGLQELVATTLDGVGPPAPGDGPRENDSGVHSDESEQQE